MAEFRTNLDHAQPLVADLNRSWKHDAPPLGTLIEFTHPSTGHRLQLEVVAVVFDVKAFRYVVELHIPRSRAQSIKEWEAFFRRHWLGYDDAQ